MGEYFEIINWHFNAASISSQNTVHYFKFVFWATLIFAVISAAISYAATRSNIDDTLKATSKTFIKNNLPTQGEDLILIIEVLCVVCFVIVMLFLILSGFFLANISEGWFIIGGVCWMIFINYIASKSIIALLNVRIQKELANIFVIKCNILYNKIRNFESKLI